MNTLPHKWIWRNLKPVDVVQIGDQLVWEDGTCVEVENLPAESFQHVGKSVRHFLKEPNAPKWVQRPIKLELIYPEDT